MTKHTTRDAVWSAALRLSATGSFDLQDILREADLDETNKRTARDVLTTMADLGHLEPGGYYKNGGTGPRYRKWYDKEQYDATQTPGLIGWSDDSRHANS
jgi:hypothetical protein